MKKSEKINSPPANAGEEKFFAQKKNVVRLVIFLVAFVVAVTFIAIGVYRIGHRPPGTYDIEVDADRDLPHYADGVSLHYTVFGKSKENRETLTAVKVAYTAALKRSYRQLDAEHLYRTEANIAEINARPGEAVSVSGPLFAVLADALAKTEQRQGYSVFAGPLARLRDVVVYSFDPQTADPLFDEDLADLLAQLTALIYEGNPATLTLDAAAHTATLQVSPELTALMQEYEITAPVLDLNLLYDAYRLQMLVTELEAEGYATGYLTTESGITVLLSGNAPAEYCFYADENMGAEGAAPKITVAATKASGLGTCAVYSRIFGLTAEENGFYTVKNGEQTVYRHRYMSSFATAQPVAAVMVVSDRFHIADACYQTVRMLAAQTPAVALALASAPDAPETVFSLADDTKTVYATDAEGLSLNSDAGYRYQSP